MTLDDLRRQATVAEGEFTVWDTMAVELEVAELLYSLVRMAKPSVVVEAGTGRGVAARFLAEALQANKRGRLVTFEPDPVYAIQARTMLVGLPTDVIEGYSVDYTGPNPQIVFIDSGRDCRSVDISHWLRRGGGFDGVVVIHDANGYEWLQDHSGGIWLEAGRGVWIGQG